MIKHTDMTEEKIKNQEVNDQEATSAAEANTSAEGSASANVADDEQSASANVAEDGAEQGEPVAEPSQEEIIAVWRDKYMRLQAEFDNYRKRTLREKMDLVASGGSDVIK